MKKVLIVGAGPVGLIIGCYLNKYGIDFDRCPAAHRPGAACDLTDRYRARIPVSCRTPRIRVIQHFIGLCLTPGAQALVQFGIMLGKDLRGEQASIRCASFADS